MKRSKGLVDSIEKITKGTGIKSLTNIAMRAVGYKDCGCDKRKEWLNKFATLYHEKKLLDS